MAVYVVLLFKDKGSRKCKLNKYMAVHVVLLFKDKGSRKCKLKAYC